MKTKYTKFQTLVRSYRRYQKKLARVRINHRNSKDKQAWIIKRLSKLRAKIESYLAMASMHRKAALLSSGLLVGIGSINAQSFTLRTSHPFYNIFGDGSASPSFVDYDADGDQDMILFTEATSAASGRDRAVLYFENNGSGWSNAGTIEQLPQDLGMPTLLDTAIVTDLVGSFVDYDADGDLDLFIGADEGEIRYLRNDDGSYVGIVGAEDPFDAFSFSDNTKPAMGDIDGDGDIDAVVGGADGARLFINEAGVMSDMGLITISGEDSESSPVLFDVDADGDLDLLVGNKYGDLFYFDNTDGLFTEDASNPLASVKTEGYATLAFADVDFDGDFDLIAGESGGRLNVFAKEEAGYSEVAFNDLGLILSGDDEAAPAFVDIDLDGDMDMMMGTGSGEVLHYENVENNFTLKPFEALGDLADEISDAKPAFVDYDNDGDLDILVGSYSDPMFLYANNENTYALVDTLDNPFFKLISEDAQVPAFIDMDADNDLDLIIGNKRGSLAYFENTEGSYDSVAVDPFADISVPSNSAPAFVDIDADGDMDLVIGAGDGTLTLVHNNNGVYEVATAEENPFNGFVSERNAVPSFYDFDGDGDLDALVGDGSGSLYYFENTGGSVAVNDKKDASSVTTLYPNPVSEQLLIETPWNEGEATIEVFDQLGRRLQIQRFRGTTTTINIAALPVGNYHLKIQDDSNRAIKKIIKH